MESLARERVPGKTGITAEVHGSGEVRQSFITSSATGGKKYRSSTEHVVLTLSCCVRMKATPEALESLSSAP